MMILFCLLFSTILDSGMSSNNNIIDYKKYTISKNNQLLSKYFPLIKEINKEKKIVTYEIIYMGITGTIYNPEKNQTDNTPYVTADNSFINPKKIKKIRWVALSRDLINYQGTILQFNGKINYGDTIYVESQKNKNGKSKHPEIEGWWVVHDTMHGRFKNSIDFLQPKRGGIFNKWYDLIIKKKKEYIVFVLTYDFL